MFRAVVDIMDLTSFDFVHSTLRCLGSLVLPKILGITNIGSVSRHAFYCWMEGGGRSQLRSHLFIGAELFIVTLPCTYRCILYLRSMSFSIHLYTLSPRAPTNEITNHHREQG